MDSFKGKYVLITGASMGIGYEFAKIFARDRANLVLVARSEQKLSKIEKEIEKEYDVKVIILVKNLIKEDSPQEIFETLKEKNISVDILINNAGFGYYGNFSETDLDR